MDGRFSQLGEIRRARYLYPTFKLRDMEVPSLALHVDVLGRLLQLGETEIEDPKASLGTDHHVGGLQITVNAPPVSRSQRFDPFRLPGVLQAHASSGWSDGGFP